MVDDGALREFLIESHEALDQLDREFVALETNPTDHERVATVFRAFHTIKGAAGFLGLSRLERISHAAESILVRLRERTLTLTPPIASQLLAVIDRLRTILRDIETTGVETAGDDSELITALNRTRDAKAAPVAAQPPAPAPLPPPVSAPAPPVESVKAAEAAPAAPAPAAPSAPVEEQAPAVTAAPPAPSAPPRPSAPSPSAPPAARPEEGATALADSNVRVDVGLLDKLMNIVGELVLARNQILQFGDVSEEPGYIGATQRLNLITSELQEMMMKTRMQPIGTVWSKLPRVVRDLAVTCGKQVRVEMLGKETELDRTVLEAIKDPLTHIVRNSIDHGIEQPGDRATAGKPRTGSLTLRSYHEGGQVIVEVSDDGRGLNLEAIRRKAIERGLIGAEAGARLGEYELAQMIFAPGFSTAEKVTNVSGRGVGMDVVKTNIERIGGTVDLITRAGRGTTIKIRIPLTLAIVPGLIVESGGQRFAIPQANLVELVRLAKGRSEQAIETIQGAPVYRLRGKLLPIVSLSRVLGIDEAITMSAAGDLNIIVLQADDRQFGLVVGDVLDTQEIVVKPLGQELKNLAMFAGATIMGDGRVALILDVVGLAQHSGAVSRVRNERADQPKTKHVEGGSDRAEPRQTLLLFKSEEENVMALPLDLVARLEELPRGKIERAGNRLVVQYRGEILPLIDLCDLSNGVRVAGQGNLPVIVYAKNDRQIGIVVGDIVDVVDEAITIERCSSQVGVLGAAVVQGRVTDLLDIEALIRTRAPWFLETAVAS